MKTFETWRKSMGETDDNLSAWEAWHARDEEISALQRQLELSHCGHRNADFKKHLPHESWPDHCEACVRDRRREQEIRREEREPICELFELWRTSSKRITFVDKESSVQWKRIWNSLVDKLTESGDYRALPEREGGKDEK